jgi:hypothetical protein
MKVRINNNFNRENDFNWSVLEQKQDLFSNFRFCDLSLVSLVQEFKLLDWFTLIKIDQNNLRYCKSQQEEFYDYSWFLVNQIKITFQFEFFLQFSWIISVRFVQLGNIWIKNRTWKMKEMKDFILFIEYWKLFSISFIFCWKLELQSNSFWNCINNEKIFSSAS